MGKPSHAGDFTPCYIPPRRLATAGLVVPNGAADLEAGPWPWMTAGCSSPASEQRPRARLNVSALQPSPGEP